MQLLTTGVALLMAATSSGCGNGPKDSTMDDGLPTASGGELPGMTGGSANVGGNNGVGGTAPTTTTGGSAATGGSPSIGGSGSSGGTDGVGGSFASSGGATTGGNPNTGTGGELSHEDLTVYIAGDSTVSTYADTPSSTDMAGWGQMLPEIFDEHVTVQNRAAGGRTALWFHLEGGVAWILERIQPGDAFFVQFGTNDSHKTAEFTVDGVTYKRYADPKTDFKTHLKEYYVEPTRARSATIVFVTPPPRNSAYCGTGNSLAAYADAMRELGEEEGVPVLDLNQKTFDHLAAICPSPTPEDFFAFRDDGTVDGTHFQENGARHMAQFLGEEIRRVAVPLANYLVH